MTKPICLQKKLLAAAPFPVLTNGHFAIPLEGVSDQLLIKTIGEALDTDIQYVHAIRKRSYDRNTYNISLECKKGPEQDPDQYACQVQQKLADYLPKRQTPLTTTTATQVSNYVDIMICVPNPPEAPFVGKGITLARVLSDHPGVPKENIIVIGDNAHAGGNDEAMMTAGDRTTCYHLGKKLPKLPHIQTTFEGSALKKGTGTTRILTTLRDRIRANAAAHAEDPKKKHLETYVLVPDIDGTLTLDDGTEPGRKISLDNQGLLQELLEFPNFHCYFCTARGTDLLEQQKDFFTDPDTPLTFHIAQLNGTHIIPKETIETYANREFGPLIAKYKAEKLQPDAS